MKTTRRNPQARESVVMREPHDLVPHQAAQPPMVYIYVIYGVPNCGYSHIRGRISHYTPLSAYAPNTIMIQRHVVYHASCKVNPINPIRERMPVMQRLPCIDIGCHPGVSAPFVVVLNSQPLSIANNDCLLRWPPAPNSP